MSAPHTGPQAFGQNEWLRRTDFGTMHGHTQPDRTYDPETELTRLRQIPLEEIADDDLITLAILDPMIRTGAVSLAQAKDAAFSLVLQRKRASKETPRWARGEREDWSLRVGVVWGRFENRFRTPPSDSET